MLWIGPGEAMSVILHRRQEHQDVSLPTSTQASHWVFAAEYEGAATDNMRAENTCEGNCSNASCDTLQTLHLKLFKRLV